MAIGFLHQYAESHCKDNLVFFSLASSVFFLFLQYYITPNSYLSVTYNGSKCLIFLSYSQTFKNPFITFIQIFNAF